MRLAEDPGRFLSTVQIGITLVGVLSGAFSGATLGTRLSGWLGTHGFSPSAADTLGVGIVVVAITYLSLILGELVPKQIALRDPERVAARVAPAMSLLSRIGAPLVFLLDISGKTVLALLYPTILVAAGYFDAADIAGGLRWLERRAPALASIARRLPAIATAAPTHQAASRESIDAIDSVNNPRPEHREP